MSGLPEQMNFSKEEYQNRIKNTKAFMKQKEIELLVIADPANICYLSGYDAWSFYVHQYLLISLDYSEPVWVGRGQDVASAKYTSWISSENQIGYPDNYVHSFERHPMDFVSGIIRDLGLSSGKIAIEEDNFYFTVAAYHSLKKHFSQSRIVDSEKMVNRVRAIKSDGEVRLIREAAEIVENVMEQACQMVVPGLRKCDLVAEIYKNQIGGMPDFAGDYTAIVPLIPSGEKTSACHLTWDDSKFENEQLMFMELAGCRKRYHCPLSRTIYLGTPPEEILNAEKALKEGIPVALEAAKAGNTCEDVHSAWNKILKKFGLEKESRLGYSIGLAYPPDWGEQTMSLRPGDQTVLEENMCFHLMPGLWFDKWGVEISEPFRVTKAGGETFCNFSRDLFVK